MTNIHKRFSSVVALGGVDLDLRWGEVHAVMGENGAGKTTLMRILGGFVQQDGGTVAVDGAPVALGSPRDAIAAGIGMVHQQFRLVEQFTTAENLALGHSGLGRRMDRRKMRAHAVKLSEQFGLALKPDVPVWKLSAGERQRVEIVRTLGLGAKILILDEPTSVLAQQETEALFITIRQMVEAGRTVVLISHKLTEVLDAADRVTVLRRGTVVDVVERRHCDRDALAHMMVGDAVEAAQRPSRRRRTTGDVAMEVTGATVATEQGVTPLKDISLTIGAGEVLGVAGVAGNGQVELAEVLTGLRRLVNGDIRVSGRQLTDCNARDFSRAGVAYIPEDRKGTGLMETQAIWPNAILRAYRDPPLAWGPLLRRRAARQYAADLCARVTLSTTDVDTPTFHLSGGNAQKLLTGRELQTGCGVLVAVNLTQGLDVAAVSEVWRSLLDARDAGTGVLLISSDLDEIMALADRIVVMYEGRIVGECEAAERARREIGLLMAGGAAQTTGDGDTASESGPGSPSSSGPAGR